MNRSILLDETMNAHFTCANGQNVSWNFVCDGRNQCIDGSDERHCYCQGDVYACLQGNNVSCRLACLTYGRVTCLTYQNTRACEQYLRERSFNQPDVNTVSDTSALSSSSFDALRYSAFLAAGILLFVSIISLMIYLIRKYPFDIFSFFSSHSHRKSPTRLTSESSAVLQQDSSFPSRPRYTPAPDIHDLPPSYYADRANVPIGDCYEPPPYPGPPLVQRSESVYYETIKTPSIGNSMSMLHPMPLPEPRVFSNIRTHRV